MNLRTRTFCLTLFVSLIVSDLSMANCMDRPPAEDEVKYSPADGETTETNPPAFVWLPHETVDSYIVQYSQSNDFEPNNTFTAENLDMTVFIPQETLQPGKWYWRYGKSSEEEGCFSKIREFEIPENAVDFPFMPVDEALSHIPQERPRLFFTPEVVSKIRSDKNGRFSQMIEPVISMADQTLEMDEPLFEEPEPWDEYEDFEKVYTENWQTMRPYTQRMVITALAYVYTGEEKYAEEARRRLMNYMEWDVEGPSSVIWPSELGLDIAEHAPWTFDWIYDYLSESERQKCLRVLTQRMEQIHYDIHRDRPLETRPYHNHAIRMLGFILEGSVVLAHDVPEARDWLDYSFKLVWSTYPGWGSPEGGWHEGVHYWTAYIRRMMRAMNELDRLGIPVKDKPFFQNTGYYGLYAAYPDRPTSAPGDEHNTPIESKAGRVTSMLTTMYKNPYFRWHAEEYGIGRLSNGEFNLFDPDVRFPASMPVELGREAFHVDTADIVQPKPPYDLPQSRAFRDVGLVAMHSNMADPENNILMLFQSNPYGAISHNHANQNSFVIEAFKEPLAIISGYRYPGTHPHNDEWIRQTKAHNSILVDNKGQLSHSSQSRGKIIEYQEHGDYVFAVGDATEAYEGRLDLFHRYVLFNRPDYFVIIDDLISGEGESTYQWLLHTINEMQIDHQTQTVNSIHGEARLTARILEPENLSIDLSTDFDPPPPDPENLPEGHHLPSDMPDQFHLTASTRDPENSTRFVTVLSTERSSAPAQNSAVHTAEVLDAQGGIALRVNDDLILWKEMEQQQVSYADFSSTKTMEVIPGFFRE